MASCVAMTIPMMTHPPFAVVNYLLFLFLNLDLGQPNKGRGEMKELRMLGAEDEQGRTCWMTAFRLFKVVFFPQGRCCRVQGWTRSS